MKSIYLVCDSCGRKGAFQGWHGRPGSHRAMNIDKQEKADARLRAAKKGWKIGIFTTVCEKCPEPNELLEPR